ALQLAGGPGTPITITPQANVLSYRVDLLVDVGTVALAFEADGFAYHTDQAAFARDRRRDRDLAGEGIETYRFTAAGLAALAMLRAEVRRILWRTLLRAA